ncbi:hypothetical protein B0H11DRAFT_1996848 [Mycena galericulata]|nr:hypothetical protein B0H11DRAFT_1996848 [Mycena galericulata]
MLPPLTHMYKRSLSAPCGARVALPSPVLSPITVAYPPTPPYFAPPQEQEQDQVYTPPPLPHAPGHGHGHGRGRGHGQGHTHVRRDTISLPVAVASGSGMGLGASGGVGLVGGYQHPMPIRRERGAYTYPPPYAHTPLPMAEGDIGPGPGPEPRYGGETHASAWWDRARGEGPTDGEGRGGAVGVAVDAADNGWADAGIASFSDAYAPSPSPPLASPFIAHAKPARSRSGLGGGRAGGGPNAYAPPPPLSPLSPESDHDDTGGGGDARFRFPAAPPPPAISRFSTLSGWAGDLTAAGPPLPSTGIPFAQVQTSGSAGGPAGGGETETPLWSIVSPSGWYKPPGWENSVQGVASGSGSDTGVGKSLSEWPPRGDVEMYYDAGAWGAPR